MSFSLLEFLVAFMNTNVEGGVHDKLAGFLFVGTSVFRNTTGEGLVNEKLVAEARPALKSGAQEEIHVQRSTTSRKSIDHPTERPSDISSERTRHRRR